MAVSRLKSEMNAFMLPLNLGERLRIVVWRLQGWTPQTTAPQLATRTNIFRLYARGNRFVVVVVGQRMALAMAVRNNRTENRFSGLVARLTA